MKPLAALVFLAVLLGVFARCATIAPAAKTCAADPSLLVEVAADLASADYEARLEQLVARVGLCIVDRTVEAVIAPSDAKADAELVAHGRAWLAAHPIV